MAGVKVALRGLKYGAENMPDKAFESIPIVGPKYFKEKQEHDERKKDKQERRDRSRGRHDRQAASDSYDSESECERERERERRARRSHRRSERDGRRNNERGYDRGYDSDPPSPAISRRNDDRSSGQDDVRSGQFNAPRRGYDDAAPYFPPPPRIAVDEPQADYQGQQHGTQTPRSYDPADYTEDTGARDSYYSGDPQDHGAYAPPPGPPPTQQPGYIPPHVSVPLTRGTPDPYAHSSASDRYRPPNADQYSPVTAERRHDRGIATRTPPEGRSPSPNYPSAVVVRPPSTYYPSQESLDPSYRRYDDDYSDEDEEERRPRRRSKDSKRQSKSRGSRSRSRVAEVRLKAKDGFEQHKSELGAGALGIVAGGLLGREFGGKNGKKNNLGMAIGAALGGIGAGLYSKHQDKQKEKSRGRSQSRSRSRRDYAGYESY